MLGTQTQFGPQSITSTYLINFALSSFIIESSIIEHIFSAIIIATIRHSIVASIPACHAGDRGSIPRDGNLGNWRSW